MLTCAIMSTHTFTHTGFFTHPAGSRKNQEIQSYNIKHFYSCTAQKILENFTESKLLAQLWDNQLIGKINA